MGGDLEAAGLGEQAARILEEVDFEQDSLGVDRIVFKIQGW
jgi:hypothetical protein